MRVLLADSRPEIRSAIRLLLEHHSGPWEICGEAVDMHELLELVCSTNPGLVVVDWELLNSAPPSDQPLPSYLPNSISYLHQKQPVLKIIVMSGKLELRQLSLQYGADAFISKGDPPEVVLAVMQSMIGTTNSSPT